MEDKIEEVSVPNSGDSDEERTDDIALDPGPNADPQTEVEKYISADIRQRYDVFSYRHAAAIFYSSFPSELGQIEDALRAFELTTKEIGTPGGNESDIPKKISKILRPLEWKETRIQGDFLIRLIASSTKLTRVTAEHWKKAEQRVIQNAIDGHKIDYVKGRVAFDLEWNSKDQTFDRDLYAFRLFHECGVISVAALVTRSALIEPIFDSIPRRIKATGEVETNARGDVKFAGDKFGASTTWMGKLLYRLNAGRHGGCPVLVFGIRPEVVKDWDNIKKRIIT
jgi:CRISPR-associated protein Csd2